MNKTEYAWVRQTRGILFDFCGGLEPESLTRPLDGFGYASIRDMLVHTADCYRAWIGSFILSKTNKPLTPKEDIPNISLDGIRAIFDQADALVAELLGSPDSYMDEPIDKVIPWRTTGETLTITPRKLLMHTVTHEYHHKGQIVSMIRHLGYVPPNTDVLGTDD
ncbi:DinB family protein [Cohnella candidum]|uniref:DUF664 domain-containing protein n=1 Tax=Cohnella candidum TaxID=2674991 RepID=A0A3G3JXL9_9BACL|nr:DinB family protein [Cohnella candidum]AYQ72964.1 DUF664 domain-containing protein [Cohnella candidum]